MKIAIERDQWIDGQENEQCLFVAYPAHPLGNWGKRAEITDEEWVDYQRVAAEFEAWQQRLDQLFYGEGG